MKLRDAIYGEFEVPNYIEKLINAPEFRRLAEVRLININSPTLPSLADVRRYSHTLGALRLAMENPLLNLGKEEHRALLASIVIHDAGTPAFAHLFEYQLRDQYDWDHEKVLPAILTGRHHSDGAAHQIFGPHTPEFERLCLRSKIDFNIVLEIVSGRHPASRLVFGSLDFDNLDNVARMNWMMGFRFDTRIILQLARAINVSGDGQLLLPESQRENLEHWSRLRRQAYEVLVFDGPTVAGQAVLSAAIADALEDGTLSLMDWPYVDHQLIEVLRSGSRSGKKRIDRDLLGRLPDLKLIVQLSDASPDILSLPRDSLKQHVENYLTEKRITRAYGYSFRDAGAFEKEVKAIDPTSMSPWAVGRRSSSLVIYGFGVGGERVGPPELGREFVDWLEVRLR